MESFEDFLANEDEENIVESEIDEENGIVDEYFALDTKYYKLISVQELVGPLSTSISISDLSNCIKQDLIQSVFDDLWSEVYPRFQSLILKISEDINPKEPNNNSLVVSDIGYISEVEKDSLDLHGAMTIKHIALQKRESSAKNRVDSLNLSSLAESNTYDLRPESARSFSSRPASAKPKNQSVKANWKRYL